MVRQFIQVRAENSRSSPHTYVLGLNSLEDYVVQAFLYLSKMAQAKDVIKKTRQNARGGGRGGHFHKERILLSDNLVSFLCLHHTTGTVQHTTY